MLGFDVHFDQGVQECRILCSAFSVITVQGRRNKSEELAKRTSQGCHQFCATEAPSKITLSVAIKQMNHIIYAWSSVSKYQPLT